MLVRARDRFVWTEKPSGYITAALFLVTVAGFFIIPPRLGLPPSWFESAQAISLIGAVIVIDLMIGLRFDTRAHVAAEAQRRDELAESLATYRVTDRRRPGDGDFLVQWRKLDGEAKLISLQTGQPIDGAGLRGILVEEKSGS